MANWDNELDSSLKGAIDQFQSQYRRAITPPAMELLRLSIAAIDGEPRPDGAVPNALSDRSAQVLAIRMVPILLRSVSRSTEGPIGVFQLLEAAPKLLGMYFAFSYPPP
jgi:hypothetical protein